MSRASARAAALTPRPTVDLAPRPANDLHDTPDAASLDDVRQFLPHPQAFSDDDIAGALITATGESEAFLGLKLIQRDYVDLVDGSAVWTRLAVHPVASIERVEMVRDDGTIIPIPGRFYAIDIDARGDGYVRLPEIDPTQLRVSGRAGQFGQTEDVPGPIRLAIGNFAASILTTGASRLEDAPHAVAALLRPFRRMRLQEEEGITA